jgi:hypothetical protein
MIDVIVSGFDCEGDATSIVLRHEGREIDRTSIAFSGSQSDQRARAGPSSRTWSRDVADPPVARADRRIGEPSSIRLAGLLRFEAG